MTEDFFAQLPKRMPVELQVPQLGQRVHYVAYGSPNGEYGKTCRVADVLEVGLWMMDEVVGGFREVPKDRRETEYGATHMRTATQFYIPDRCRLEVHNPSGIHFNDAAHQEYDLTSEEYIKYLPAGVLFPRGEMFGGTWHYKTSCPVEPYAQA